MGQASSYSANTPGAGSEDLRGEEDNSMLQWVGVGLGVGLRVGLGVGFRLVKRVGDSVLI